MRVLDYIFYRATRYYDLERLKREPEIMGFYVTYIVAVVSLIDIALPFFLLAGPEYLQYAKPYAIGVTAIVFPICLFRYTRARYDKAKALWDNEDRVIARKRGMYLKICASVIVSLPFLVGILRA